MIYSPTFPAMQTGAQGCVYVYSLVKGGPLGHGSDCAQIIHPCNPTVDAWCCVYFVATVLFLFYLRLHRT